MMMARLLSLALVEGVDSWQEYKLARMAALHTPIMIIHSVS
jgi:hypothetical protein